MQSLSTLLTDARRAELARGQREASLTGTFTPTIETELVEDQVADVEWDVCTADGESPCYCKDCERAATESMMYARASYRPMVAADQSCECGGMLDEYDRCNECDAGHDDCDVAECFRCFEAAVGRAEAAAEGMER